VLNVRCKEVLFDQLNPNS